MPFHHIYIRIDGGWLQPTTITGAIAVATISMFAQILTFHSANSYPMAQRNGRKKFSIHNVVQSNSMYQGAHKNHFGSS